MEILLAYATKHGSTAEVADSVAATLAEHGHAVELHPARDVRDLTPYDAVILGGALYMGRLHRDARRFLHDHRRALATLPFAVFAMGPGTLEPEDLASSRHQLAHGLQAVPEVQPRAVAIFGGVVDPAGLRFPFNHMPAADARDWEAIRAWGADVAAAFEQRPART